MVFLVLRIDRRVFVAQAAAIEALIVLQLIAHWLILTNPHSIQQKPVVSPRNADDNTRSSLDTDKLAFVTKLTLCGTGRKIFYNFYWLIWSLVVNFWSLNICWNQDGVSSG